MDDTRISPRLFAFVRFRVAVGQPPPASSARLHHFTLFVILGSDWDGQDQLHDLFGVFQHALKFAAR